jgi:hypothetical protein
VPVVVVLLVVHHWDHGRCPHIAFGRLLVASLAKDEEDNQSNYSKADDTSDYSTNNSTSVALSVT